jgi:hypothetical protein
MQVGLGDVLGSFGTIGRLQAFHIEVKYHHN